MQTLLNGVRMDPSGFVETFVVHVAVILGPTINAFGCTVVENLPPLRYLKKLHSFYPCALLGGLEIIQASI